MLKTTLAVVLDEAAADSISIIERIGVDRENHSGGKNLGEIEEKIIRMKLRRNERDGN